jgi:hypothetical protein
MANTFTVLFRGAASTESTTLYTTPAGTKSLVTSFIVANTSATDVKYTITMNGVDVAKDTIVAGPDTIIIEFKQLLDAGQSLAAYAESTAVNFSVTGLEIT